MRTILISLAAAASALAVAAPASAQAYGNLSIGYGSPAYGAPYGHAYGYNRSGPAQWARELREIRMQADQLNRMGRLTRAEGRDLYRDLYSAERQLRNIGRRGISGREAHAMNNKIARIRYELHRYSDRDHRRYGRNYGYRY